MFLSLLVTGEKPLDLLDDWQVAGVPLGLPHFTPVPDKLLDGGLELVHVKDRGRTQFLQVLLENKERETEYPKRLHLDCKEKRYQISSGDFPSTYH